MLNYPQETRRKKNRETPTKTKKIPSNGLGRPYKFAVAGRFPRI